MQLYLVYGAAGLGILLALSQAVFVLRSVVNLKAFTAQLIKLVRANNVDRALRLCQVAPMFPLAQLLIQGLTAALEEEDRDTRARRMEQAYAHGADKVFAPVARVKMVSLVALGLCLMAAAFALAMAIFVPYPYGIAGFGAVISLYLLKHSVTLRTRSDVAFKKITAAMRRKDSEG